MYQASLIFSEGRGVLIGYAYTVYRVERQAHTREMTPELMNFLQLDFMVAVAPLCKTFPWRPTALELPSDSSYMAFKTLCDRGTPLHFFCLWNLCLDQARLFIFPKHNCFWLSFHPFLHEFLAKECLLFKVHLYVLWIPFFWEGAREIKTCFFEVSWVIMFFVLWRFTCLF